jgi:hypothetical protein
MGKTTALFAFILLSAASFAAVVALKQPTSTDRYNLIPIAAILIVVYVASWFLSRQKKLIDIPTHRKIWNALLIISFAFMAVLAIDNTMAFSLGSGFLPAAIDSSFWHTEFGIAFVIIGVFHAAWHIPYISQYIPKFKPKEKQAAQVLASTAAAVETQDEKKF